MTDYKKLVEALRCCAENFGCPIECPRYSPADEGVRACVSRLEKDAAAAIEELQAENVAYDKAIKDTMEGIHKKNERIHELEAEVKDAFNRGYNAGYTAGIGYMSFKREKEPKRVDMVEVVRCKVEGPAEKRATTTEVQE